MPSYTRERCHPRVSTRRAILVQQLGSQTQEHITVTRAIGLGGCMIHHSEPMGTGSFLHLWLGLRDHVVRTEGTVVWEQPAEDGWQIGLQFLRLSAADRASLAALVHA